MPLGMKSHISTQFGSSLNLTSRSFFFFSGKTDAISESWQSVPKREILKVLITRKQKIINYEQ